MSYFAGGYVLIGCLVAAAIAGRARGQTIVDVTHTFDQHTIYWPTESGFQLKKETAGLTERGYFYAANAFAAPEHGGTHIDAPYHFSKDGITVDKIPLERLMGAGACVDVSAK
jgi:kynurenine formamidase